jgi:hypothetical protein
MLHMVISTHSPGMCPMVNQSVKEKSLPVLQNMDSQASASGVLIKGSWVNVPAHVIYTLVEAPNAHFVNKWLIDNHIMEWNNVTVSPVDNMKETISMIK